VVEIIAFGPDGSNPTGLPVIADGSAEETLATSCPATGRRLRVIDKRRVRDPHLVLIQAMLSGSLRFGYLSNSLG
jgi:hypothetical protein